MRKKVLLVSVLIFTALCSFAQISDMGFSFQGYAIDPDGKALADKNVTVKFTITPANFEEEHGVKTDAFGVFHAIIGNSSETKKKEFAKIKFSEVQTLKVEVKETSGGTYQTISNEPMKAVPYSRFAANGVPVGTIIAFGGAVVPKGWMLCNGRSLSSNDYPQLYDAIGQAWGGNGSNFNLPDLRGMFLRGVSGDTNNDPDKGERTKSNNGGNTGNNVGTLQGDEFKKHNHNASCSEDGEHTHKFTAWMAGFKQSGSNTESCNNKKDDYDEFSNTSQISPSGKHSHTITIKDKGGKETRPKNAAVNYIIKY